MGWGSRASIDRMDYAKCVAALATARNKGAGKPMGAVRIFDRGTHYAVQQYSTDIIRYYADGSFAVCTNYTSNTTISAIHDLTGKVVRNTALPTFDGRLSNTLKHREIDGVVFKGVAGYIRFDANDVIDLTTVLDIDIQVISDKGRLNSLRKRVRFLALQIELRRKLGVLQQNYFTPRRWLMRNLEAADKDVQYDCAPEAAGLLTIKAFDLAHMFGATKTIQFKEFA